MEGSWSRAPLDTLCSPQPDSNGSQFSRFPLSVLRSSYFIWFHLYAHVHLTSGHARTRFPHFLHYHHLISTNANQQVDQHITPSPIPPNAYPYSQPFLPSTKTPTTTLYLSVVILYSLYYHMSYFPSLVLFPRWTDRRGGGLSSWAQISGPGLFCTSSQVLVSSHFFTLSTGIDSPLDFLLHLVLSFRLVHALAFQQHPLHLTIFASRIPLRLVA